jgi:hypothetical protein
MPQTIDRPTIAPIPADLIEAETLNLLGIEVIDLQDYTDYVIPHGDDRYQIWLGNEFSGLVWTWVNQFITPFRAYNTLFEAVCSFFDPIDVAEAKALVAQTLQERFDTIPVYF